MRKKILLLITMFLGALYVGCSSDDGYLSYELDEDAKLQNTKNLILSYGQKYGLSNIQFNDELLRKHLNITNVEAEYMVASIASFMEKGGDNVQKFLRRTGRRSFSQPESNPSIPHYTFEGTVSESESKDGINLKYDIKYYYDSWGVSNVEVESAEATKEIKDKSGKRIAILSSQGTAEPVQVLAFIADITNLDGSTVHYTIKYNVKIYSNSSSLSYSFKIENKLIDGDSQVKTY